MDTPERRDAAGFPLPAPFPAARVPVRPPQSRRDERLRLARRIGSVMLAAVLGGVGTAAIALARVTPAQSPGAGPRARNGQAPTVNVPVAVSSGSQVVPGTSAAATAGTSGAGASGASGSPSTAPTEPSSDS